MPKKHALVIEDDERWRSSLLSIFDEEGYYVDGTGNEDDAFRMLSLGAYDAVVCDNSFPRSNGGESAPENNLGLEVLVWMRNIEKYVFTPFVLHTAGDAALASPRLRELNGIFCEKGPGSFTLPKLLSNAMLVHA